MHPDIDSFRILLDHLAALRPFAGQQFPALTDLFTRVRGKALAAAPAYAAAVPASADTNPLTWVKDMSALKDWAGTDQAFADAFAAARDKANATAPHG